MFAWGAVGRTSSAGIRSWRTISHRLAARAGRGARYVACGKGKGPRIRTSIGRRAMRTCAVGFSANESWGQWNNASTEERGTKNGSEVVRPVLDG